MAPNAAQALGNLDLTSSQIQPLPPSWGVVSVCVLDWQSDSFETVMKIKAIIRKKKKDNSVAQVTKLLHIRFLQKISLIVE